LSRTYCGLWSGHSLNELQRPLAWIGLIALFIAATIWKVLMVTEVFGGMWITRNVKHTNRYGIESRRNPEKHPKL
jgi:hypothetical protein